MALAALSLAPAQSTPAPHAAQIVEAWRGMPAVLERALAWEDPNAEARTVWLCIDATASLSSAGLPEALSALLEQPNFALGKLKVGVHKVGAKQVLLPPSEDRTALLEALRAALAQPDESIQDLYSELRMLCQLLGARAGERAILLASLENGDAENDIEATVQKLKATKTRLFVLGSESYLADSYWAERSYSEAPRDCELRGGDNAIIDLPFGWLFQIGSPNEATPSGFGDYALSRLVAASEGKLFLYQAASSAAHQCMTLGSCLFCSNDHIASKEYYRRALLEALAPSLAPRTQVLEQWSSDPYAKATLTAWRAALQAGLVRGSPPRAGHLTFVDGNAQGKANLLTDGKPDRNVARAETALKECKRILSALEKDLERIDASSGSPRARAIAEFCACMLDVTQVNLIGYIGWCEELAPSWFDDAANVLPPEIRPLEGDPKRASIGFSTRSLCHGARPFLAIELPGGARLREALSALDQRIQRFEERYAHTPYVVALHRQGIAIFHQVFNSRLVERPRPRSKSGEENGPSSGTPRPGRAGRSSASGTGPTSGGGG